ncbi:RNA methyltransferase, TrmH family, group 3 [Rubrobacter radiotolerans]|uniref:23S rRNA (Guanosine(2251)-2'-O)-methyltransferase RlmB n=1 Tax=Rubrobacter radiotolerans TaxID=42256 RepID=A0A023X446_RUBRA|nr:23S rRNA (guanosine(2251)-2'-O)-methyltransferase RlmB [Rubrobacter radiotolerans]AHY47242.1 RNA methyltransferase, TrmH family, group 3 [Rubrobacter radiotolerans]MDX5894646.1 23S rRNA (guanosine(2251)-2'-O)-methyltransferase RlmB [Rubrobacter radiotolerans]SMC06466.1 23S rRNA (guanosine2251-2'-O)-methyltransferase [Rubrobacter radiotolerans DSM 5868]
MPTRAGRSRTRRKARCSVVGRRRGKKGSGGRPSGSPSDRRGGQGRSASRRREGRPPAGGKGGRPAERRTGRIARGDGPALSAENDAGGLVYGVRPVVEALRSRRREVFEVLDASGGEEIGRLARERGVRVTQVGRDGLDSLAGGGVHQGVAARVGGYPYVSFQEVVSGGTLPVVVLDGVTDPHNLGAILRVADGAGVSGVVIPKDRSAEVNATVAKASAGASEHVRVTRVTNLRRALDEIKERGYWVFAAEDGEGSTPYTELDLGGPVALVLGSEGRGIRRLVREGCDGAVSVPMGGEVASLNVSVAAAVLLFEARRQREGR